MRKLKSLYYCVPDLLYVILPVRLKELLIINRGRACATMSCLTPATITKSSNVRKNQKVVNVLKDIKKHKKEIKGDAKDKHHSKTPRNALRDVLRSIKYRHLEPQVLLPIYRHASRGLTPVQKLLPRNATMGVDSIHSSNSCLPESGRDVVFEPQMAHQTPPPAFDALSLEPQIGFSVSIDADAIEAIDDMTSALKNLSLVVSLDNETRDVILEGMKTLEGLKNTTHKVELESGLADILEKLKNSLPEMMILFLVCAILIAYSQGRVRNPMLVGMVIGYFASQVVTLRGLLDSFMSYITNDSLTPQSGGTSEVVTLIVGAINSYLCMSVGSSVFDVKQLSMLISALSKTESSVKSVIDMIFMIAAYVRYGITRYIMNDKEAFIHTGTAIIDDYLGEYEAIRFEFEEKTLFNNENSLDRVRRCISKAEALILQIPTSREMIPFRMRVSDTLMHLNKYKTSLLATNFKFNGQRQEPVSLLFRGAPGVGKSLAMQHFAHVIARDTFNEEDYNLYAAQPGLFIYNRQSENVFWDGYDSMKRILFVDDMLQARDVVGNPDNEIMGMIRAINIFENQLHCAAMELKGNTTFRSAFVLANTNMRTYNFESICEPTAFLRRWDIVVDVFPSEEYCVDVNVAPWDRKIDFSKLPIVNGETMMHPDQLSFAVCKLKNLGFEATGEVLDFAQLTALLLAKYNTKRTRHLNCLAALEQTLMRPQVIGDQPPRLYFRDDMREYMNGDAFAEMYWLDELESDPDIALYVAQLRSLEPGAYEQLMEFIYIGVPLVLKRYVLNLQKMVIWWKDYRFCKKRYCLPSAMAELYASSLVYSFDDNVHEFRKGTYTEHIITARNRAINSSWEVMSTVKKTFIKALRTFIHTVFGLMDYDTWLSQINKIDKLVGIKLKESVREGMARAFSSGFSIAGAYLGVFSVIKFVLWIVLPKPKSKKSKVQPQIADPESGVKREATTRARITRTPTFNNQSGEKKTGTNRARIQRTPVFNPPPMGPQGIATSHNALRDMIHAVTKKNVYEFWAPDGDVDIDNVRVIRYGSAIALGGTTLMFPYHFITELAHARDVEKKFLGSALIELKKVESENDNYYISVDSFLALWKNIPEFEKRDQALVKMPKSFPPARDISHLFVSEKKLEHYGVVDAALYIPYDSSDELGRTEWRELLGTTAQYVSTPLRVAYADYIDYEVARSFIYSARTTPGDCGALLYADDPRGPCVLGFHIAGSTAKRVGMSTIITDDIAKAARKAVGDNYTFVEDLPCAVVPSTDSNHNITPEAVVEAKYAAHSSGKTKIVKSPLHSAWGPAKTQPARLTPFKDAIGKLIEPMKKARSGYCKGDVFIPESALDEATASVTDMLFRESKYSVEKKVYTFEEAVVGDGTDFFKSIPRNTSAGFPYTSEPGPKTKERFFGTDETYDLSNPECQKLIIKIDEVIEKAKIGLRTRHVYVDFLKDERRKHAKVEEGNTRMVSGTSTPLLIAMRMYFGAFMKWINANSIDNGISIGICEYSQDWDYLARKLQSKGGATNVGAGDYKNFDMSLRARVMWRILDIINLWYSDYEGNKVREILWYEIVNSCHLNGNTLYNWPGALASGGLLTALVDSLYNHFCFRLVYINIFGGCSSFNANIYLTVGGDDHAYNASPQVCSIFTERNVQINMEIIGMKYTPEDKDKIICDDSLRHLSDITYLKRRFIYDEAKRRYVAPLDIEVILEMPYWVKDGAATLFDCENNLKICFEELSLHPQPVFESWKAKIIPAVMKTKVRTPENTFYHSLRRSVLDRDNSISDRLVAFRPQFYVTNPDYRLRMPVTEYHDGKSGKTLLSRRPRVIKRYCQGGVPAIPAIPRNHDLEYDLVESILRISTANTPTNQSSVNKTDSFQLTQQPGSVFIPTRTAADGTSFDPNSTAHATNDAEAPSTSIAKYVPLELKHLESADTGITQDVANFLAKPYLLQAGSFATTDTFSSFIFQQNNLFHSMVRNNSIWANKLSGNLAVKGDMVFTLFVNGNRFQQGRYIMAWVPDGGAGVNSANWVASHCANITQVTQLPRVDIDVNVDTQATLTIPFVNAIGWSPNYSGANNYGDVGSLIIVTYSPLVSPTGSTTAKWSLYVHLENVCYKAPFVPQSGRSRTVVKKRPAESEQDSSGKGPISSFLSKVSTAGQILSGVPILSSVAGPVSWAADIGASVASVFGWSKPSNLEAFSMISRYIFPKYNNADTIDSSMRLAVMDSAAIEDLPGFAGSDVDEMALSYVQSIPALFYITSWSTATGEGSALFNIPLSPLTMYTTKTYGASTVVFPTPVSFCTNFFSLYRGSLKFTFKFVKTEFHSGRLAVSFLPYDYNAQGSGATTSFPNSEYLHREIIDIRTGSEFTFVVPYVSLQPYRPTFGNDSPYGVLFIHVLNPLVAPSSVSSSVAILVEVSAGPDFELAYPRGIIETPVAPFTPQVGRSNIAEIVSTEIGNSNVSTTLTPAKLCIGERVLSFRQLIKRFNPLILNTIGAVNSVFQFYPYSMFTEFITGANVYNAPENQSDILSIVSFCYALSRGSIRYKILDTKSNDFEQMNCRNVPLYLGSTSIAASNFSYQASPPTSLGGFGNGENTTLTYTAITGGIEAEFPYYSRTFAHPTADVFNNKAVDFAYNVSTLAPRVQGILSWSSNPTGVNMFRAAGEDFSLGLFVSTPGFINYNGAVA